MGKELVLLGGMFLLAAALFRKDLEGIAWMLALGAGFAGLGLWTHRPKALTAPRLKVALGAALWAWHETRVAINGPSDWACQ